jgi:hypothetical protein
MKKALLFFLAAAMLLPLAACSGKTTPDKSDVSASSDTDGDTSSAPPADTAPEYVVPDELPELNFDGEAFRILQGTEGNWLYTEELNGENLNDTVFERNRRLETRFNVVIEEPNTVKTDVLIEMASQLVHANDDVYDVVSQPLVRMGNDQTSTSFEVLRNVLTLPYIDLDKPWYTKGLRDAIVDDRLLALTGDMTLSYTSGTVVVYFNKTKWIDYLHSTDDLYQIVRDGKWTVDRLMSYSVDLYHDVNGNGKRDEDDFYGFSPVYNASVNAFVYGSELRRIKIAGDSWATYEIVQDMYNEKLIDLYIKLKKLMTESQGAAVLVEYADNTETFMSGNALFTSLSVSAMTTPEMVAMEDDFGVLPIPKWDEDQQEYHTNVDCMVASIVGVLKTVQNVAKVGAMIEAMSAASYTDVMPVYCESVLELRHARDPESSEMLRMIMDTRVMDWETLYSGYDGWASRQRKLVNTFNCPELVSGIVERVNAVQNIYENIMETIWNLE